MASFTRETKNTLFWKSCPFFSYISMILFCPVCLQLFPWKKQVWKMQLFFWKNASFQKSVLFQNACFLSLVCTQVEKMKTWGEKNGILWNFGIDFQILITVFLQNIKIFGRGNQKLQLSHLEFQSVLKKEFLLLEWAFLII